MTRPSPAPRQEGFEPSCAEIYGALASVLNQAGRLDEALAAYRRACDLGEALFRANPEDPETGHELARNLGNLGVDLSNAGRPAEALKAYDRAQEVLKVIGDANPTLMMIPGATAWIEACVAGDLMALGREAEALSALEQPGRPARP